MKHLYPLLFSLYSLIVKGTSLKKIGLLLGVAYTYCSIAPLFAQINNLNVNINVLSGTTVVANQSVSNQAAGVVSHSGTLIIRENLTNDGSFTGNTNSLVAFEGAAMQYVYGGAIPLLYDMRVNNGAQHVTLENSVRITNNLLLTNGRLFAPEADPVLFAPTALNPAESNANRIVGRAVMETRNVGVSALNFLNANLAAGADMGNVTLNRRTGTLGIITINSNESIACYWTFETSAAGSRNITFSWLSDLDNGKDLTQMQRWRTASYNTLTDPWVERTPIIDISSRSHSQGEGNIQNSWTFSDMLNPLPIELRRFEVEKEGEAALVWWETASEKDLLHYELERSYQGQDFVRIHTQVAKNEPTLYRFVDNELPILSQGAEQFVYYRLKWVETNGETFYSPVRALALEKRDAEAQISLKALPNPFENQTTIEIKNPEGRGFDWLLTDVSGKVLSSGSSQEKQMTLDLVEVVKQNGVYFFHISYVGKKKTLKVIKY
ncbi:T9SS type A sorting domain-containing protein [Hugenholtzia roseola]|uniref:T9SS type A sorting domain-containing protein n=1 Tax=Hugenholtzia roseola TaxID=1002 RepID=UPI000479DF49|nr:T9SS type A sorting domain-containing protein [Hugenholtzia roseola]